MSDLNYNPMDSIELNNAFQYNKIEDIDGKIDYLIKIGVSPEFAKQLEAMRLKYSYSTDKIMQYEPEIIAANNRINSQSELSWTTKTNLAIMKESA